MISYISCLQYTTYRRSLLNNNFAGQHAYYTNCMPALNYIIDYSICIMHHVSFIITIYGSVLHLLNTSKIKAFAINSKLDHFTVLFSAMVIFV